MENIDLIEQGNQARAAYNYDQALKCYAQVLVEDPNNFAAFNNYGNVLREMGYPERAIPFLEYSRTLDPTNVTAEFNLAVAHLLKGDYEKGWPLYESRWRYEHLSGLKPNFAQPEWRGQDLKGRTILVLGEQGLGDQIQFVRFVLNFVQMGAKVKLHVNESLKPLFNRSPDIIFQCTTEGDVVGDFDYWVMMMDVPGRLGITVKNIPTHLQYIVPDQNQVKQWQERLGPKTKMRIGICWSGRKDSWLNQHKSMPVETMAALVARHPEYQWFSLQVDATEQEQEIISAAGAVCLRGQIKDFTDTGSLIQHMDLIISVDTSVAHMSGAMGRPTWIPLNAFGPCWRWLLNTDSSPWYPSVRLFRQPTYGQWDPVIEKIEKFLSWFKV